ncbi:hypothetical protein HAX54_049124 [Datura stramonium]|uniref:Uncharacterized protein n=1 Tax=Datura stramonium TaxID=4076 RepID=A0ABS8SWE5_DATST|nr:hypothetical protein [Datura stramonium]
MGKNQMSQSKQGQGVCEKIFKAVNISPTFRSFRRISPESPNYYAAAAAANKATISKPIALAQNGSTIPLEFNPHQITSKYHNLSTASNMVPVEYNHSAGDAGSKAESVNKSPHVKKMVVHDHQIINEGPKDDNDRFSKYIDHVKNKMRKSMSSFNDNN